MSEIASVRADKRAAVLTPICAHLLNEGLDAANLRALAKAAGTSDRMLLYYFSNKDDLIGTALTRLAEQLSALLDEQIHCEPQPEEVLTETVWTAVCHPDCWPFMVLFVELAVRAHRIGDPFASPAQAIAHHFQTWLADHLAIDDLERRSAAAERVLTVVDGRVLLRLVQATAIKK
ncbi:MAG: TetR/AcrR family transcriptional regulator [Pseudomonadota bacterium]